MTKRGPLSFLEATKLASESSGRRDAVRFCLSGNLLQLGLFLRAEAACHGIVLDITSLEFGTLGQHLLGCHSGGSEAYILCPWDLVPSLDWRSGINAAPIEAKVALQEARATADLVKKRSPRFVFYLDAPIPPVTLAPAENRMIASGLVEVAHELGAISLGTELFGLSSYLSTGCPFAGPMLGHAARIMADEMFAGREPKKVLVTDLDDTLWAGIVGEEGLEGISAHPEAAGFRHFIYQCFLRKLKESGILLAAVSRNDPATVKPALEKGRMVLCEADFAATFASYQPKSAQIAELSKLFNIGLGDFVFVDDNPVELEEVKGALPEVTCLQFPKTEANLPELLERLHGLFPSRSITDEDRKRTEFYRVRAEGATPVTGSAHDITAFLASLGMKLTFKERREGDRARAVQLINKTNQFNLNGKRWDDGDVAKFLASNGHLYTATLSDKNGEHGEIMAMLVDSDDTVHAFVLSCRVFQRKVEHATLSWVLGKTKGNLRMIAVSTPKNEPIRQFLADPAFTPESDGSYSTSASQFEAMHGAVAGLFQISSEE